jgi:hypothetical protein
VRAALRLLVLLGLLGQAAMSWSYRHQLAALRHSADPDLPLDGVLLFLAPAILGLGGATLARTLARRGSRFAAPAAALALFVLLLWFAGALYVTLNPLAF